MKYLCLNLKRFDIPTSFGGVNQLALPNEWGAAIISQVEEGLASYKNEAHFPIYFPEAHLLSAAQEMGKESSVILGCQGVYHKDVKAGGNFGAFTTHRPASAMKALGVKSTIIGHFEERLDKFELLGKKDEIARKKVNQVLNQEIHCNSTV